MTAVEEARPHCRDPKPGDQCSCGCDAVRVWVYPDGNEWAVCTTEEGREAYVSHQALMEMQAERTDFGEAGGR